MKHMSEEQLILYHYGEAEDRRAIEEHLLACGACREEMDAIRRTLNATEALPVPERNEGYGREVWAQLQPKLEEDAQAGWLAWLQPHRWALAPRLAVLAATMAAVLSVGILVGRYTGPNGGPGLTDEQVRERILLVAVGDHLESSQMVLVELVNAGGNGTVDISSEQQWADDLVEDNRLYRLTAAAAGETALASLLEDLERVLLEVARSPEELSSQEFNQIRDRIEEQGIIFKIKVLGSKVREREEAGWKESAADSSQT